MKTSFWQKFGVGTLVFFLATAVLAAATPALIPPAPEVDAHAYIVLDLDSGKVIAEKNADQPTAPASLTKIMSVYLIASALQNQQITLDDPVTISPAAWKTGGSRMFVKVGSQVKVRDLIQGIIVASGNDATVAMAEHLAGSEQTFTSLMNQTASRLGMTHTHFVDATGLPNDEHYTTPRDLAILTRALLKNFPQYHAWYQQKWFTYNHIKQPNRNRLLWRDPHVAGIKTGHTDQAGYCVVNWASDNDMHLVSVIMGSSSDNARFNASESLLKYAFRLYRTQQIAQAQQALATPRVWQGTNQHVTLGITSPLYVTTPVQSQLTRKLEVDSPLFAPITQGQAYGKLKILNNDQVIAEQPLVALANDPKGGLWTRIADRVGYWIHNGTT